MNKNKAIKDIAKQHNSWVNYIRKNSMSESQFKYAEDFVQNLYVKLLESKSFCDTKIYDSEKQINRKYVFTTLRWLMLDDVKKVKLKTTDNLYNIKVNDPEIITSTKKETLVIQTHRAINKMPENDKKIMKLYMYEIPSIRKIAKSLKKGTKTIQLQLKNCKQLIKSEIYDYRETA
jgi:RNA polymerase sigma factor (sigma-70 family)